MLYRIIAIFDQMPFANDAVWNASDWNASDAACAQPPTRAPDNPSSTR